MTVLGMEVAITGNRRASNGRLEVLTIDDGGYPGVVDADLRNNTLKFRLDPADSGQLPPL